MGGIGEGGREAKKHKQPPKNYKRDQTLFFRTRYHLCKQGVALASIRQLCSQGSVSIYAHRTEGVTGPEEKEGANGTGTGSESGVETETITGSGVGTET